MLLHKLKVFLKPVKHHLQAFIDTIEPINFNLQSPDAYLVLSCIIDTVRRKLINVMKKVKKKLLRIKPEI